MCVCTCARARQHACKRLREPLHSEPRVICTLLYICFGCLVSSNIVHIIHRPCWPNIFFSNAIWPPYQSICDTQIERQSNHLPNIIHSDAISMLGEHNWIKSARTAPVCRVRLAHCTQTLKNDHFSTQPAASTANPIRFCPKHTSTAIIRLWWSFEQQRHTVRPAHLFDLPQPPIGRSYGWRKSMPAWYCGQFVCICKSALGRCSTMRSEASRTCVWNILIQWSFPLFSNGNSYVICRRFVRFTSGIDVRTQIDIRTAAKPEHSAYLTFVGYSFPRHVHVCVYRHRMPAEKRLQFNCYVVRSNFRIKWAFIGFELMCLGRFVCIYNMCVCMCVCVYAFTWNAITLSLIVTHFFRHYFL